MRIASRRRKKQRRKRKRSRPGGGGIGAAHRTEAARLGWLAGSLAGLGWVGLGLALLGRAGPGWAGRAALFWVDKKKGSLKFGTARWSLVFCRILDFEEILQRRLGRKGRCNTIGFGKKQGREFLEAGQQGLEWWWSLVC